MEELDIYRFERSWNPHWNQFLLIVVIWSFGSQCSTRKAAQNRRLDQCTMQCM